MTAALFNEVVFTESRSLRTQYKDRVDALDKVGHLITLPDGINATMEMVADFYEVPVKTIASVVNRNRAELETNGLGKLDGSDLQEFKARFRMHLPSTVLRSSHLTVFTRQTILNVGQLLQESTVAEKVRKYLLTVEAVAAVEHREAAVKLIRLQERRDYKSVLDSLKLGGAVSDDYGRVQNHLYLRVFGETAAQIRARGPERQTGGILRANGKGFRKSTVAKDFMTRDELARLDAVVLATIAQVHWVCPNGAPADKMIAAVDAAVAMLEHAPSVLAVAA